MRKGAFQRSLTGVLLVLLGSIVPVVCVAAALCTFGTVKLWREVDPWVPKGTLTVL